MARFVTLAVLFAIYRLGVGEEVALVQNNTFNSSYVLSASQIQSANLSNIGANNVEVALNFERTNWATGSIGADPFYEPPPLNSSKPGSLLKVQDYTNTSYYTLAPNVALSRFLFTSADVNGSVVPASAYILWPWQAKSFEGSSLNISGVPVISWAHGTSGVFGECGPSHIRNLWYQFSAPYILALQGYAVVAPDYAGLGVNRTAEGKLVAHQYLAHSAAANDLFYAAQAAQAAFPELSKQFVVMGHSQGGGAAWGAARRQFTNPVEGYLGTVAASPDPDIIFNIITNPNEFPLAWRIAVGITSIFPDFDPSEWLEEEGVARLRLIEELSGCNSVDSELFTQAAGLVKPGWESNWYLQAYANLTNPGRKQLSGPMLVLQGTQDPAVIPGVTSQVVNDTCALYPQSQIQYDMFEGATHVPTLDASQQIWLKWIEDRFMGKKVEDECNWNHHQPLRSVESYQKELKYYLQISLQDYTVAILEKRDTTIDKMKKNREELEHSRMAWQKVVEREDKAYRDMAIRQGYMLKEIESALCSYSQIVCRPLCEKIHATRPREIRDKIYGYLLGPAPSEPTPIKQLKKQRRYDIWFSDAWVGHDFNVEIREVAYWTDMILICQSFGLHERLFRPLRNGIIPAEHLRYLAIHLYLGYRQCHDYCCHNWGGRPPPPPHLSNEDYTSEELGKSMKPLLKIENKDNFELEIQLGGFNDYERVQACLKAMKTVITQLKTDGVKVNIKRVAPYHDFYGITTDLNTFYEMTEEEWFKKCEGDRERVWAQRSDWRSSSSQPPPPPPRIPNSLPPLKPGDLNTMALHAAEYLMTARMMNDN